MNGCASSANDRSGVAVQVVKSRRPPAERFCACVVTTPPVRGRQAQKRQRDDKLRYPRVWGLQTIEPSMAITAFSCRGQAKPVPEYSLLVCSRMRRA